MPTPEKLRKMKIGVKVVDDWIRETVEAIERALNVTGSGPISVRCGPQGTSIGLNLLPFFAVAKASASGIPARSGSTLGKGTITHQDLTFGSAQNLTLSDQPTTDTAYHLDSQPVKPSNLLILVRILKFWVVVWEDCQEEE